MQERTDMPTRRCAYDPLCNRAVTGVHANCETHERELLRQAFGAQSWHEQAATGTLRPMVVGGVRADG